MHKLFSPTILVISLLAMAVAPGCTSNIRNTEIGVYAGHDMVLEANGAQNTTSTEQATEADLSGLAKAAAGALGSSGLSSLADRIKSAVSGSLGNDNSGNVEVIE